MNLSQCKRDGKLMNLSVILKENRKFKILGHSLHHILQLKKVHPYLVLAVRLNASSTL